MYTLTAVFCLALFWLLRKKANWMVSAPLAVLGGAALALSFIGGWITWALSGAVGFVVGLLPAPVSTASLIATFALALLILVATDVCKDKKLDQFGQYAAIGLPVLLLSAGGGVGAAGSSAITAIAAAGSALLAPLVGG